MHELAAPQHRAVPAGAEEEQGAVVVVVVAFVRKSDKSSVWGGLFLYGASGASFSKTNDLVIFALAKRGQRDQADGIGDGVRASVARTDRYEQCHTEDVVDVRSHRHSERLHGMRGSFATTRTQ